MIIDTHAHFTTAPPQLDAYRGKQMSSRNRPGKGKINIGDDQLAQSLQRHLTEMQENGTDRLIFSPRASGMNHDVGDERMSRYWTEHCNDLIYRAAQMFPDRFIPACQLPQSPGISPGNCIAELDRCVTELGFVGCNVNPDVSGGGQPFTPSLNDPWWNPLWEKLVELDVPALLHASTTIVPALHLNGSHYTNVDAAAVFDLAWGNVFQRFPTLKVIVPHGGGNLPFIFNRLRALFIGAGKPRLEDAISHLYFDTAVYDTDSIDMLLRKVGVGQVVFAAEIIGTAKYVDPETGRRFDDVRSLIDDITWLTEADRYALFEGNARKLYSRATF